LNPALKDNPDDFDRNKQVNPQDQLFARSNQTSGLNGLKLIAVTNPSAAPAPAPGFAPASAPVADPLGGSGGNSAVASALGGSKAFVLANGYHMSTMDRPEGIVGSKFHLPLLTASPPQIRQAIRDALCELHDDSKESVDDDLLEVLGKRFASRK
jgi:hypothetical protein